jgi:hypothetical protein
MPSPVTVLSDLARGYKLPPNIEFHYTAMGALGKACGAANEIRLKKVCSLFRHR